MLHNLVIALRRLGREEEARRASRRALALPGDNTSARHSLWMAADEASCGAIDAATARLTGIDDAKLKPFDFFLSRIARATLAAAGSSGSERKEAFTRACRLVQEAERRLPNYRRLRELRRIYHRCVRRIAAARGGPGAALWAFQHWIWL
jgi:predicted RNA polymerase sigma factor